MLNLDTTVITSPVRSIQGKVELFDGSTLLNTYAHNDALKSIELERIGEGKFFGYGISQKINIKLIDIDRSINITTDNSFKAYFNNVCNYPLFKVTEVNRDENTNELSITAYDRLYEVSNYTVSELTLPTSETETEVEVEDEETGEITTETVITTVNSYTILQFAEAIATFLGTEVVIENVPDTDVSFYIYYENGANFEGTENFREALDDIAEATQTIYYFNNENKLVFKRLDKDGEVDLVISKADYYTLDSSTNRRLSTITKTSELGDSISASITETGTTQYVRDNAFYELREDIAELLEFALDNIGGLTINQFECEWRGNYLLEIGDKIGLVTKDNDIVYSYALDDVISYEGAFSERTQWNYAEDSDETTGNPTTIGESIKQTFAKVDKVNKQIDLVVSEVEANKESISALQMNTESISASVSKVEENLSDTLEGINGEINTLTERVEATMTAEDVRLEIQSELDDGVTKVTTSTGFTFDDVGLTIDKTNGEMKTTITEDGMIVYKNDESVLVANNVGVEAKNLHATTYLIIGNNSRFEDYTDEDGESRTGCFWIGS